MKTRILKASLIVLMCAVLMLTFCACSKVASNLKASTSDVAAEDALWADATYLEDVTLGEGSTTIDVKVTAGEKSITVTIHTDATNLEDALTGVNLVEGEQGEFGIFIKKVNGIVADFDVDSTYWGMFKDGEYLMEGANATEIKTGDQFELVRTK